MFVFYNWPFPHVYFAKNVAYFRLILGSVFSDCVVFYVDIITARCYASAVLAMGLCLSVCLSQVGVLQKRLNIGSQKQHHTIAGGL